ncbi:hypothetical protein SNE40_011364 [Patella caerulea]|uniref:Uncharacterized protein n=1 Tax=Patella caerulea TaxID=87958 RepID=A0AAN8JMY4_PATCE
MWNPGLDPNECVNLRRHTLTDSLSETEKLTCNDLKILTIPSGNKASSEQRTRQWNNSRIHRGGVTINTKRSVNPITIAARCNTNRSSRLKGSADCDAEECNWCRSTNNSSSGRLVGPS